jgi:hypothetical protein
LGAVAKCCIFAKCCPLSNYENTLYIEEFLGIQNNNFFSLKDRKKGYQYSPFEAKMQGGQSDSDRTTLTSFLA